MKILGFDLETTGVDKNTAEIVEIGAVLFDTDDDWKPLGQFQAYIMEPHYTREMMKDSSTINKISFEMLQLEGRSTKEAIDILAPCMMQADAVMAYNKDYDRTVIFKQMNRLNMPTPIAFALPWICAMDDVVQNEQRSCKKLSHLALDWGVMVDPTKLHGAIGDCMVMGDFLRRLQVKPEDMIARSKIGWQVFAAQVSFDNKKLAQDAGYSWQKVKWGPENQYPKLWVKAVRATPENIKEEQTRVFKTTDMGERKI